MATATKTQKTTADAPKRPTYRQLEKELACVKEERAKIQEHAYRLQRRWEESTLEMEKAAKGRAAEYEAAQLVAHGLDIERVELIARAERLALRIKGLGFNPRP